MDSGERLLQEEDEVGAGIRQNFRIDAAIEKNRNT